MSNSHPKNVFVIGAQRTGKTTLVNAVKEYYLQNPQSDGLRPRLIIEVARTVLGQVNMTRDELATSPDQALRLQEAIIQAQYEAETAGAMDPDDWYISDRSGVDPIVYTQLLVGEEATARLLDSMALITLEANMRSGLVFLCEAGCTWLVDDGISKSVACT